MSFTNTTFIDLGSLRIHEPMTAFTDLIISAVCFVAFFDLKKRNDLLLPILLMKHYFLCFGLATSISGLIGHAFLQQLGFVWKLPGWVFSALAASLAERAALERTANHVSNSTLQLLRRLNVIKFAAFLTATFYFMSFAVVGIHLLLSLLGVMLPLYYMHWQKTKNQGSKFMLYAILLVLASSLVFVLRVFIHNWFNHMDLSHILLALSVVLFHMGTVYQLELQPATIKQ